MMYTDSLILEDKEYHSWTLPRDGQLIRFHGAIPILYASVALLP